MILMTEKLFFKAKHEKKEKKKKENKEKTKQPLRASPTKNRSPLNPTRHRNDAINKYTGTQTANSQSAPIRRSTV
jgi:hypothetical protein